MATPTTTTSPQLISPPFSPSNRFSSFKPSLPLNRRNANHRRISMAGAVSHRKTLSSDWDLSVSPELLDTNEMLLNQRVVFLGSHVERMTADLIVSQLLMLDASDSTKEIKLFINSPGGSITDGMAIYDGMKLCKAEISTICIGLAANVAAFLLASGSKGKRFCMPNSRVMIQQPFSAYGGPVGSVALQVKETTYQRTKMLKIYSIITGKPLDQIDLDTDHENFMDPWQAKEYGLVDAVLDDGKPGLVAPVPDPTAPPETNLWSFRHGITRTVLE
ncbi:hypothetical protein LUZ60_001058 [Juncus effusus]|nr:hypothetical protein LUZ60_001058 [Juncus effusus]